MWKRQRRVEEDVSKNVLENYRWLNELCIAKGEELVRFMVLGENDEAEQLRNRLVLELRMLNERRDAVVCAIDKVEDEQLHLILTLRYLIGLSWKEIESRMGYSRRRIQRLHVRALRQFKNKYEK